MSTGAWIALAAVAVAVGLGLWRQVSDGRFRGTRAVRRLGTSADPADTPAPAPPPGAELVTAVGAALGERATLVQFSSAFCAPCRATRRVLGEVTGLVEGVVHVEVDAEQHLDATRAFGILRTPTTLVLDASGAEVARATGAPSRDQVLATLARA
ncbi:TlpA family protein disulfide reductase [Nocardioides hwasunensis]|uniref:Thioredoxin family protein n=1 Tax=Nocardioides hwasunensis TaxID=397258 RepID=A0ABR8MPK9_9ACTN|nr:thioredoxin family protein [Nocardioides hwasunensis]MBD3916792.1 thioredoxin family protein [Nocardioides hwasunensis]